MVQIVTEFHILPKLELADPVENRAENVLLCKGALGKRLSEANELTFAELIELRAKATDETIVDFFVVVVRFAKDMEKVNEFLCSNFSASFDLLHMGRLEYFQQIARDRVSSLQVFFILELVNELLSRLNEPLILVNCLHHRFELVVEFREGAKCEVLHVDQDAERASIFLDVNHVLRLLEHGRNASFEVDIADNFSLAAFAKFVEEQSPLTQNLGGVDLVKGLQELFFFEVPVFRLSEDTSVDFLGHFIKAQESEPRQQLVVFLVSIKVFLRSDMLLDKFLVGLGNEVKVFTDLAQVEQQITLVAIKTVALGGHHVVVRQCGLVEDFNGSKFEGF